jgi:ribosomal protein L11
VLEMSSQKVIVEAMVEGGKASGGPPIGPALGPTGVNIFQVVTKINEVTQPFSGLKVPVKIIVDPETKGFEVEVGTPPTSALILKEIGQDKGSGEPNTATIGNLTVDHEGEGTEPLCGHNEICCHDCGRHMRVNGSDNRRQIRKRVSG